MKKGMLKRDEGFTIIEVVLVLAIAGLIFLIVFLALPQLQRSRRDTQRKNDVGRILASLESRAGNANGEYPDDNATDWATFETAYLTDDYNDPTTGAPYVPSFSGTDGNALAEAGEFIYRNQHICDTANPGVLVDTGNNRDVAITMRLEEAAYCQDNR